MKLKMGNVGDPCQFAGTHLRKVIKFMISETLEDGHERGATISRKNGSIEMSDIKKGSRVSVVLPIPSILGLGIFRTADVIGSVHTHPDVKLDELFSLTDIETMFNENMEFAAVGYFERRKFNIAVFTPEDRDFPAFEKRIFLEHFDGENKAEFVKFVKAANRDLERCVMTL